MKIAIITFCRGSDAPLLALSNQALKHHELWGDNFPRIVVDEEKSAVENPECDVHLTREFSRGTTLDGKECAIGMMNVYREIVEATKCDYVLKIDCDVLALDTKFLSVLETQQFYHYGHGIDLQIKNKEGQTIKTMAYCQGAAYAIAAEMVRRFPLAPDEAHDLLIDADTLAGGVLSMERLTGYAWPEDETISRVTWFLSRDPRRFGWEHQDAKFGHLGTWDYGRTGGEFNASYFERQRVFDFLECGKTSRLKLADFPEFEQRRNVTRSIMEHCLAAHTGIRPIHWNANPEPIEGSSCEVELLHANQS